MAEQGFILDIDTKFIKRLEEADKALAKSVESSEEMSSAFNGTVLGASRFADQVKSIISQMEKLGGIKFDDSGFATISTDAMTAEDKVNLLTKNMLKFQDVIRSLKSENDGTWLEPEEMFNEARLRDGIKDIEDILKTDFTLTDRVSQQMNNELKAYKDALKELKKSDEERVSSAASSVENALKHISKLYTQETKEADKLTKSYEKALSANEHTLTQRANKMERLKAVEKELSKEEVKYAKELETVRQAIVKLNEANGAAAGSTTELHARQKSLFNTAEQLKRQFSLLFSVSAIRGYVNQIASVRGEFELQQRSLQALLQSKADADALWEKTIALAVRSPFRVKDLVTYTKQLAAYRVESDKLYDTNKMLADISAGLGVDMNRLVLAYGQVKAANYLRGTELRQFSEAGINILSELSEYFTELEGKAVSVGEVFARVSKRMVSFADVESVLKKVTGKGGVFYNMQEVQSETLKGQIANLKDSIDLMMNELGKQNEQVLKGTVSMARAVLDNWRVISGAIQAVIAIYGVLTIARIKDAVATGAWTSSNLAATAASKGFVAGVARMIVSLKALKGAMATHPVTAFMVALTTVGTIASKIISRQKEINNIYAEGVGKIVAIKSETEAYGRTLVELARRQEELNSANKKLDKDSDDYKKNQSEIISIEKERKEVLSQLKNIAPEFVNKTKEIVTNTKELARVAAEYNAELRQRLALEYQFKEVPEDVQKYEDARQKYLAKLGEVEASKAEVYGKVQELLEDPKQLTVEQISILRDFITAADPYVDKLEKLRKDATKLSSRTGDFTLQRTIEFADSWQLQELEKAKRRAEEAIKKRFKKYAEEFKVSDFGEPLLKNLTSSTEDDRNNAKNAIIDYFEGILDDKKIVGDLREDVQNLLSASFSIDWTRIEGVKLEPWQKGFNSLLEKLTAGGENVGISNIKENTTLVEDMISAVSEKIKYYKGVIESAKVEGQGVISNDMITEAERAIPILEKLYSFLGAKDIVRSPDKDPLSQVLSNRISLIKKMNSAYVDLRAKMGKEEAFTRVAESYRDAFEDTFAGTNIKLSEYEFDSIYGVIEMLERLKPIAEKAGKEASRSLEKEIGSFKIELIIEPLDLADNNFVKEIENMFSGYELSLELGKLDIPKEFANSYFGIQTSSLDDIKKVLAAEKAKSDIGTARYEKIVEWERKISDLEKKEQQERLKTYLAYARDSVSERAKIKLEELKKLQEIELAFGKEKTPEKEAAEAKVKSDSDQALKKLEWEEFQKSDTFISIFQDLEKASTSLIQHALGKLKEFRNSWADMPHEEMKSIVSQIEKLEQRLVELGSNPIKAIRTLKKELEGIGTVEAIQKENAIQQDKIDSYDKEIAALEVIRRLRSENKHVEAEQYAISQGLADVNSLHNDLLDAMIIANKDIRGGLEIIVLKNNENIGKLKILNKLYSQEAEEIEQVQQMTGDLYGAFKDLNEVLGGSDGPAAIFADMGMSVLDAVMNCLALQAQLEAVEEQAGTTAAAMNAAMGVIGWIVMGVQVLSSALGAVFQAHDNKLERQIQRIQSRVEELNKRLETLDELMDKAFSTEAIEAYSLETQKNIEAQIDAYDRMIALEKDKKKTDSAKIKEYREAQNDLRDQYEEMIREAFSTATSGVLDDVLSTSRGFVDAWYEAFKETGNGVGGLKKQFDSLFKDIILQQAALQVMSPYIEMLKDEVAKYIDPEQHDYTLTPEEAMQLKNFSDWWAQSANEAMSNFANAFGFGSLEQGDLSDLSKGIQGITESTAQVLEALLNSMRFYVADSNTQLRDLKAAFMSSDVTMNPILNELKQHTQLIRSIESMFDSVIGRGGSSHNGAYLRVLM